MFLRFWGFRLHLSGCPTYRKLFETSVLPLVSNNLRYGCYQTMDEHHMMLVAVAAICIHQLLVSYYIIFDDVPTASEARTAKRHKRELTPYKRILSVEYGRPTTNLEHIPHLERILQDINRPYMKDITHLHGWQFFLLAD
jgi:hypothetical protein